MAFRKRNPTFRRSFRPRPKNIARKRRNWSQFSIDPCDPLVVPQCEPNDTLCCSELAKFVLLSNQELQDLYSDRCTVVRLLGDLWFQPVIGSVTSAADLQAWMQYLRDRQSFLGLRSGEISSIDQTASFDIFDTTNHDDLSEGRWRKTWQFFSSSYVGATASSGTSFASSFDLNIPVADVHTTGSTIPGAKSCSSLTSGTGFICVDSSIDCQACPQGIDLGDINFGVSSFQGPSPWHVHLDVKKRFPMRENQELYLMYNNRSYTPASSPNSVDSETRVYGNVRVLTEMG